MRRREASSICGGALAFAGVLVAAKSLAQSPPSAPPSIELEWKAPPACPTRQRILDDVGRMVRAPRGRKPIAARVTIVERAGIDGAPSYVVSLSIDDGTRKLEGDRCEALGQAAAFILALAIDPDAKPLTTVPAAPSSGTHSDRAGDDQRAAAPPARPPSTIETPVIDTPTPSSPARSVEPSSTPSWGRVFVAAEAALDFDVLPKPALGPLVAAGVRFVPISLRAEIFGALFFEQTTALPIPGQSIGANVSGMVGGARVAAPFDVGAGFEVGPAAGLVVHALQAKAFGATSSTEGSAQWFGLVIGGHVAWRLHANFALRADLQGDIALARPQFVIENAGTVHRPPLLSGCAAVGPELRFF